MHSALNTRAAGNCELCEANTTLNGHAVLPHTEADADHGVALCEICAVQLVDGGTLDAKHLYCLQGSIWSEIPAVQVVAWRLLKRLTDETWAQELLEQVWLDDATREWAEAGQVDPADEEEEVVSHDSNGKRLHAGDTVSLTRSLDVKGTSFVAKRGTMVRNIRLNAKDPSHIEGKVNGTSIYIKTCYLKKVG